jgi:hypothetical protein
MYREYFGYKHGLYAYLLTNSQCCNNILAMVNKKQKTAREAQEKAQEEQEIRLLREWLPKISGECRAYIKGATKALLYTQEEPQQIAATQKGGILA